MSAPAAPRPTRGRSPITAIDISGKRRAASVDPADDGDPIGPISIALGVGLSALIAMCALAGVIIAKNLDYTDWVTHTYQVEVALSDFRNLIETMETARRGWLLARDEGFKATFNDAAHSAGPALERIAILTVDNPVQQARVARLRALTAAERAAFGEASNRSPADVGPGSLREVRAVTNEMANEEQTLLHQRDRRRRGNVSELVVVTSTAGLLVILVAAASVVLIYRYTRALTASRDALRTLNEGLEDTVRERTSDLQRANDEIQRFAYIVSHDLRSPLVNVMGFTSELEAAARPLAAMVEQARVEAPHLATPAAAVAIQEDIPEAIRFIRASTQKMDRLINAILKLSRDGRRILSLETVEVEALAQSIIDSLRHRADDAGAQILIEAPLPQILSDRLVLEQIFSNLIENALKYVKSGRPGRITVRGRLHGDRRLYEIIDNGRGVDPKDHERIFELFRRSGAQDQPGEGIGLAQVRALAHRLGGAVTCESRLDEGALFRVSLPAAPPAEREAPI